MWRAARIIHLSCGPRDIISDGKDGLLVEDGNIEQLAEKISYLIENEDIRKKMDSRRVWTSSASE